MVISRSIFALFAVVLFAAVVLAGCSASFFQQLPANIGGLPTDAPPAPQTPYQYPAVHDLPSPRATKPMSEEEQVSAENALRAARDKQQKLQGAVETGKE